MLRKEQVVKSVQQNTFSLVCLEEVFVCALLVCLDECPASWTFKKLNINRMFSSERIYGIHKVLFNPNGKKSQWFISFQEPQRDVIREAERLFFERYGISGGKGNMLAILSAIFVEEVTKGEKNKD